MGRKIGGSSLLAGIFAKHFRRVPAPPEHEREQLFDCACGQRVFARFELEDYDSTIFFPAKGFGVWLIVAHDKPDGSECKFELPDGCTGIAQCAQCDSLVYFRGDPSRPALAPHDGPCGLPCAGAIAGTEHWIPTKDMHKRALGGCVRCGKRWRK